MLPGFGICLAAINISFYFALKRLPMSRVAAMEVLGTIGVGARSSIIPYICDQLAMSRLPRWTFAVLLPLLPATATIIAAFVLAQMPSIRDLFAMALVMIGVVVHRPAAAALFPGGSGRSSEPL